MPISRKANENMSSVFYVKAFMSLKTASLLLLYMAKPGRFHSEIINKTGTVTTPFFGMLEWLWLTTRWKTSHQPQRTLSPMIPIEYTNHILQFGRVRLRRPRTVPFPGK